MFEKNYMTPHKASRGAQHDPPGDTVATTRGPRSQNGELYGFFRQQQHPTASGGMTYLAHLGE